jgi:hypothetical protein
LALNVLYCHLQIIDVNLAKASTMLIMADFCDGFARSVFSAVFAFPMIDRGPGRAGDQLVKNDGLIVPQKTANFGVVIKVVVPAEV